MRSWEVYARELYQSLGISRRHAVTKHHVSEGRRKGAPFCSSVEVICKIAVLDISFEALHDAVLVLCVMAEMPHVQNACHSVGFARPRRAADEDKRHILLALSHIQMSCGSLQSSRHASDVSVSFQEQFNDCSFLFCTADFVETVFHFLHGIGQDSMPLLLNLEHQLIYHQKKSKEALDSCLLCMSGT